MHVLWMIDVFIPKETSKRANNIENPKHKTVFCKYYVEICTRKKEVCKSAFISSHGISDNDKKAE